MKQRFSARFLPLTDGLFQRIEGETGLSELETRQPTTLRENTSMTKATYTKLGRAASYVKSLSQS